MAFGDQGNAGTDLAWRAVTALEGIMINERLLQRMQMPILGQALDARDACAVLHDSERKTRYDAAAINQHRAGAALAVVAALFAACQVEMLAQEIEQ
jgi:hypothetical protein